MIPLFSFIHCSMYSPSIFTILILALATSTSAQTWCNKHYMANQSITPPGGNFPIPLTSSTPLLSFRCAPAIRPYLAEDKNDGEIIIDSHVTYTQIDGAQPITLSSTSNSSQLHVEITVNGKSLANASIPLDATKLSLPISLSSLQTQKAAYNISCTATYSNNQSFSTFAALSYLPNPANGTITKMDLRSGALLAKPVGKPDGPYEPVFPIGFYTSFGGYLATNLSILNELKEQGFTVVHPVPTFDNTTQLMRVLDRMEQVGLYLMYDMRFSYMNSTAVTEQVNLIKNHPSLLLWYTGDEPDGTSDPLTATKTAYDLIYDLDGYHPVSLVLNCYDYEFAPYTSGADIVMQDTYMIGNNVTYSVEWHTPCTPDFGDCGCDDCQGDFEDISRRMDLFAERLNVLGWEHTTAVWTVPQAFGGEEYWSRAPTGNEYLVQSLLGVNHGALGIIAWNDPTPADIKSAASSLAKALPGMTPYILNPTATFANATLGRVDVGMWSVSGKTLVIAVNLNYTETTFDLGELPVSMGGKWKVEQVFDGGSAVSGSRVSLDSVGSGAFLLQ